MTIDEELKAKLLGNRPEGNTPSATLRWVEVVSVDADEKTMDAKGVSDGLEYFDIELGSGSVIPYPIAGSLCLIGIVEGMETNGFLISATEVEKIEVTASTEIVLNGGTLGGLVKVQELTDAVNKMVDTFNGHTHTITTPHGAGSATAPTSSMEKLKRSSIENEKVKQ